MPFTFQEALTGLGADAAFRIANAARPPANYLFNTFLPERNVPSYHVDAGNMTVRTTMAGLVGMDSPYPPGGIVEISKFMQETAKIAIENKLTERAMRQIQEMMMLLQNGGSLTNEFLQREALNFLQKLIVQALLDTSEWLRAQAIVTGVINWEFNQKTLAVNYDIPADNMLTTRTVSGNDAYSGTASAFWADVTAARRLLRNNVRAAILNSTTMDEILGNAANNLQILSQENTRFRVRRYVNTQGNTQPDEDVRYSMEFIVYDEEAEVFSTTEPGKTEHIKFMPDGKIAYIGANTNSGYRVGQGSTDDPQNDMELGYTHLAPTVEGNGQPGRWSDLFVPERMPMQLHGRGASNELPVITAPEKIVVATTELAA